MRRTNNICGPSSYGRCKMLKRSPRGADLRSPSGVVSSSSNTNARTFLRRPGPAPMLDVVAKSPSSRVPAPSRRGVAVPLGRRPRHVMLLTSGGRKCLLNGRALSGDASHGRRRPDSYDLVFGRCNRHAQRNAKPFSSWRRHTAGRYFDPVDQLRPILRRIPNELHLPLRVASRCFRRGGVSPLASHDWARGKGSQLAIVC
jgi:hypothetical protein